MSILKSYEQTLASHAPAIGAIESSVRTLTWLLPGRFADSELAAEGVAALLALLGVYHDALVAPAIQSAARKATVHVLPPPATAHPAPTATAVAPEKQAALATPPGYVPSLHTRYTLAMVRSHRGYRSAGRILVLLTHIQLVLEMLAQRRSRQLRPTPSVVAAGAAAQSPTTRPPAQTAAIDLVVGLESVKLLLRLWLFFQSGQRPVLHDPLPQRELDPADLIPNTWGGTSPTLPPPVTQAQTCAPQVHISAPTPPRMSDSEGSSLSDGIPAPWTTTTRQTPYRGKRTGQTWASLGWMGSELAPEPRLADPTQPSTWGASHPLLHDPTEESESEDETLVDPEEEAFLAQYRTARVSSSCQNNSELASALGQPPPRSFQPQPQPQLQPELEGEGEGEGEGWTPQRVDTFLLHRTLAPTDVRPITALVRPVQGPAGYIAELLHLIRPLVYALLVRRYVQAWSSGQKKSAWTPVGLSFGLDVLSRYLRKGSLDRSIPDPFTHPIEWAKAVAPSNPLAGGMQAVMLRVVLAAVTGGGGGASTDSGNQATSDLESDEWAARTQGWGWYLLRGPIWTQSTRPRVQRALGALRSVPVLGLGAALAEDYLPLVDRYYYFSSR